MNTGCLEPDCRLSLCGEAPGVKTVRDASNILLFFGSVVRKFSREVAAPSYSTGVNAICLLLTLYGELAVTNFDVEEGDPLSSGLTAQTFVSKFYLLAALLGSSNHRFEAFKEVFFILST